jgi:putative transposase
MVPGTIWNRNLAPIEFEPGTFSDWDEIGAWHQSALGRELWTTCGIGFALTRVRRPRSLMPRPPRITPAGTIFHIVNRGNERRQLFFQDADYEKFLELLRESKRRYAVFIYAHQLMPNHFHLLLEPKEDGAVSAALHWIQMRSSRHLRKITNTQGYGHVLQRRFWCRAIRDEFEYLAVAKYVEANALRAGLVKRAEDWRWGSLWERVSHHRHVIDPTPVPLPQHWVQIVNLRSTQQELDEIRRKPKPGRRRRA